jgi:cytochrome c556
MLIPPQYADLIRRFGVIGTISTLVGACGSNSPSAASPASALRPIASIQELMQAEVDRSADGVWNAVATINGENGTEERRPQTPEEWAEVRLSAIALIEASNLLVMGGRRVGAKEFPAEADGALDSKQIQALMDAKRSQFNAFAAALRETSLTALAAIDAKDPAALVKAGGAIEAVCEACHLTFWYPNQIIPPFPKDDDPNRPIVRVGVSPKKAASNAGHNNQR